MIIQNGQPIYWYQRSTQTDYSTPDIFGVEIDPQSCDNIDYVQLVDDADTLYMQFDLEFASGIDEIETPTFTSTNGWTLGAGWSIAGNKASITNAAATSSLTATSLFDSARVGFIYKILITVQVTTLDGVVTFKNGTTEKQLTEGDNVFYIDAQLGDFEIEAAQGASIVLTEASAEQMPSQFDLAVWDEDNTYQDRVSYMSWVVVGGTNNTDNQIIITYDVSGLADGCYYFTFVDPTLGWLNGQSGLANGEFNVGNPVTQDMNFWTETLGAGVTVTGGDGLCTYASTSGNGGTLTNTSTELTSGIEYTIDFKINSSTDARVRFNAGAVSTAFTAAAGTYSLSITPVVDSFFEIEIADLANPSAMVLDYVRLSVTNGGQLGTPNASNKFKVGDYLDCTHFIEGCLGGSYNFSTLYRINYRVASKIVGIVPSGERIINRASDGTRSINYANLQAGKTFQTDIIAIPEIFSLLLAANSNSFKIDDVEYQVINDPDDISPQSVEADDNHASVSIDIVKYNQRLELFNCDGTEPVCG